MNERNQIKEINAMQRTGISAMKKHFQSDTVILPSTVFPENWRNLGYKVTWNDEHLFVPYLPQELDWLLTADNIRAAGFEHVGNMVDQLILQWRQAQRVCIDCEGSHHCPFKGLIPVYEIDEDQELVIWRVKRCQSARTQRRAELEATLSQSAGIPFIFRQTRLSVESVDTLTLQQIVTHMRDGRKNLWLCGDHGVGKTRTASAIAMAAIRKAKTVRFTVVPTLLAKLKASISEGALFSATLTSITNVQVLVLDDLGAENISAWTSELLFSIVDERINANLSTIVTSTITPNSYADQLKSLSTHLRSRFKTFETIVIRGEDRRTIT